MVFVTGGTGLLGSHLLFDLSKEDTPIRALYRSERRKDLTKAIFKYYNPQSWESQFLKIEWVKGDLLDISTLDEYIRDCDEVYHCGALVSFHARDFNELVKINREGTANIVNVCLTNNVRKLCYVSSTAAIGGDDTQPITEKTKWKITPFTSGYSISKYNAEREIWRGIEEGLNAVIVNPCVIFGAGDWNDSSLAIFKTVQKGIRFYPPGANATVDARDVSEIMIKLMKSNISGERFLCTGSNQSFKELMTCIAEQIKVQPPKQPVNKFVVNSVRRVIDVIMWISGSRGDITKDTVNNLFASRVYDSSKIKEVLHFEFRDLDEQIRNAVAGRIN